MKKILIRGGGDLATGVAIKLIKCGYSVVITELERPLSVRRLVSFSEAIYDQSIEVEGFKAQRAENPSAISAFLDQGITPVLTDPDLECLRSENFCCLVDARITKNFSTYELNDALFVVGLGPGFIVGNNCHAAIETERGHYLGRVYWQGSPTPDSGVPEGDPRRVFRAPTSGEVKVIKEIGSSVGVGEPIASVGGVQVLAPLAGMIRGMVRNGTYLKEGTKLGDVDPRNQRAFCTSVSDKAFAIGGGVLEAILMHERAYNGTTKG